MGQMAEQFIAALGRLEQSRDVEPLSALFADDATLTSPLADHSGGAAAAADFWTVYRKSFDDISSDFDHVIEVDGAIFLEWRSKGSINGQSFSYRGVTVLEAAGDTISSFRAYFDPADIPAAKASSGTAAQNQGQNHADDGHALDGVETKDLDAAQREAAEQRAKGGYS